MYRKDHNVLTTDPLKVVRVPSAEPLGLVPNADEEVHDDEEAEDGGEAPVGQEAGDP